MFTLSNALRRRIEAHPTVHKVLLGCGVAACGLYVAMDAIAAVRYEGYRYANQTISELSAIDAPTRSFWMPLSLAYGGLTVGFGLGVLTSSSAKRSLQVVGSLAVGAGVLGLVGWPFAPMHQREVLAAGGDTFSDTMHLVLGGASSLLFVLSIGFGASTFGKRFRRYSIGTLVVMLVAGAATAMQAPKVSANEPTPWIGVTERIAAFSPMLWYSVLAIGLVRRPMVAVHQPRTRGDAMSEGGALGVPTH